MVPLWWNQLSRTEHHPVMQMLYRHPEDMEPKGNAISHPLCGIQGANLWSRAVDMPSGGMPLLGTLCQRTCQLTSSLLQGKLNFALLISRSLKPQ